MDKGVRELKKLEWDMNDGTLGETENKIKRSGRVGLIKLLNEDYVMERARAGRS